MFGRLVVLAVLGALYHRHGAAYWASAQGRRLARSVARLVYLNTFLVVALSLAATRWEIFWLHMLVAFLAIAMYAAQGWRPVLAIAAGDWGVAGNVQVAEYLARAIASALFLAGWWNLLAPTPALNFHAHPISAAFFSLGVILFILRKEFVSPSLKETKFFKWSTALIAGPAFAVLLWSRAVPIFTVATTIVATAPAGSTLADAAVAAATVGAERSALVANAAETAAYHMANISWPISRRLEVGVPAGTRVSAGVKLANDMPVRVTVSGPAGATARVLLWDATAGAFTRAETVTVGAPLDLRYLGLKPVDVAVEGGGAPTTVLFDRGVR